MELASKHFNVTMEQRLGFGGIGWPCEPSVSMESCGSKLIKSWKLPQDTNHRERRIWKGIYIIRSSVSLDCSEVIA